MNKSVTEKPFANLGLKEKQLKLSKKQLTKLKGGNGGLGPPPRRW